MTIVEAREALTAALATNNAALIASARAALATAEKKSKKAEDAEDAEGDDDEEEAPPSSKPGMSDDEPDGDEEPEDDAEAEEDGEDGEDAEDGKKMKKGKKSEASALLAALGVKSIAEARGKIAALNDAQAQVERVSRDVAKIKGQRRKAKVDALFADARRDGKVTRAEVEHLRKAFAGKPLAELRAYLSAKPRVASTEFAKESAEHLPAGDVVVPGLKLDSAFAQKAMRTFGVKPEDVQARAAALGLAATFPGSAR